MSIGAPTIVWLAAIESGARKISVSGRGGFAVGRAGASTGTRIHPSRIGRLYNRRRMAKTSTGSIGNTRLKPSRSTGVYGIHPSVERWAGHADMPPEFASPEAYLATA